MKWFASMLMMLFLAGCETPEYEVEEIPTGYKGKARVNPYLAAERFAESLGYSAESSRVWDDYSYETGLIFMPGAFLGSKAEGMRALEWVEEGGVLVIMIEGGEPERNDFTTAHSGGGVPNPGDYPGLDHLLLETGIEMTSFDWEGVSDEEIKERGHLSRPWHYATLSLSDDAEVELEFEGRIGLKASEGFEWEENGDLPSRVISTFYGGGAIVVMSHARPFRSPYLARSDHAAFLEILAEWDVSGVGGARSMVFLYGSNLTFWGLLWQRAWMVLVPGLILLAVWLWMRIPRLGPVMADLSLRRKPYGVSLTDEARFLYRRGKISHLIRPLRERLEAKHQGDPATLYQRLADQSGLSREEVTDALTSSPGKETGPLIKLVQKLQILLKR